MDQQQQQQQQRQQQQQQELQKIEQRYLNAKFPEVLLKRIILFLNAYDIEQALKVCYLWYTTCTNESFWMKLFLKEFGPHGTYFNSHVSPSDLLFPQLSSPTTPLTSPPLPSQQQTLSSNSVNTTSTPSNEQQTLSLSQYNNNNNSSSSPNLSSLNIDQSSSSSPTITPSNNSTNSGGETFVVVKKRNAETPDFYKQPQCKWRNAYLYRIQMQNLFKNGNLSITKMYTQPDLQILQMKPSYLKSIYDHHTTNNSSTISPTTPRTPQNALVAVERNDDENDENDENDEDDEENVLKRQKEKKVETTTTTTTTSTLVEEELGMVDEQSKLIFDLTVNEEENNRQVWKDCGFHLFDIKLIDDYICLNCKKYYRHMEKTAVRKNSRHMLAYKLTTARDIHAEHDPSNEMVSQWTCAVLNKSSEYGRSITNANDRILIAENLWIEGPVLYSRNHEGWSAGQLMNDARHYPSYGSFYTAWAPASRNGSLEFLELMFEEEVYVCGIDIFETYLPGAVYKVSVLKKDTQEFQTVWLGPSVQNRMPKRSRIFSPVLKRTNYKTNVVRIDIDTRGSKMWTEIDCVRLHGYRQWPSANDSTVIVDGDGTVSSGSGNIGNIGSGGGGQEQRTPRTRSIKTDSDLSSQYDDMVHLVRQGHVEKFPYEHITSTPFDLHHGLLATVITESMYYHISCSLVVTGASSFLRNKIFLEAKYIRDYVIAVKILSNWTVMAIVKQFKMPLQYVIHVWCLRTKKLLKTYEMKECTNNFNDEIAVWELADSAIACIMGKSVCLYDIYHPQVTRWKHLGNLVHPNLVTSVSMNSELEELCNVVATGCTDGNCRVWSLRTRACLYVLPHQSPVSDVKLIAGGSMVATCCVGDNCIRFWTLGKTVAECVKIVTAPGSIYSISNKVLNFDGASFSLFVKGTNEFSLCRFTDPATDLLHNKQIMFNKYSLMSVEQQHTESCTLL